MSNSESPAPMRSLAVRVFTLLCEVWWSIRERLLVLKPCRVPVFMVLAGLAFLFTDQGQDVLRALAEHRTAGRHGWRPVFFFFGAALAWSLYGWYWARVMLYLQFPDVPDSKDRRLHGLRVWTPRLLGFLATLGVAGALYVAARGYAADEQSDVKEALLDYAFWCLLGSIAFLIAVTVRRRVSRFLHSKLTRARMPEALQARASGILNVSRSEDEVYGALKLADLSRPTGVLLGAALGIALLLFFAFLVRLQPLAPLMGSASILLLAAAGWIAVGSMLDFAGMRLRFPVFITLIVLAIVFSWWNDNHAVRTLDVPQAAQRENLRATLRAWLDRQPLDQASDGAKHPMYVVNAEGGGIRAAYWTATVLGEIQNRNPCFAERLFSLSGVSGGSLGASLFLALLVEQRAIGAAPRCGDPAAALPGPFDVKRKAQAILGEDFLSPVVAGILYPDLMQRVLFWPVERFDRAVALEEAWERAWRLHVPPGTTNRLAEPFDRLWSDATRWTPALFLNATWVETGKRLIVSNVAVVPRTADDYEDFVDVEDAQRFFAPRSVRLSTAAHMSARFTYVSPAGTLMRDGRAHARVVDGGYFENSGATTTLEILKTVGALADDDPRWAKIQPIVIHISNDPVDPSSGRGTLESAAGHPTIAPKRLLNEVRSPISTLFNTRGARGVYARDTLYWHVGGKSFLHFGLCRHSDNVPLGWALSRSTRDRMDAQLTEAPCRPDAPGGEAIFDNAAKLKLIDAQLRRPGGALPVAAQARQRD